MEAIDTAVITDASNQYVGQWNRLVSTTNWEKGRIILEWRAALIAAGAPATDYSDEAWAQQVGNVSSQHVGRLRRVAERYATDRDMYQGLYWSHFAAALEWNDAEMWLEGAVQNNWSISQMKKQRAEVLGEADQPANTDELDEDSDLPRDSVPGQVEPQLSEVQGYAESSPQDALTDEEDADERGAPFEDGEMANAAFEPDFGEEDAPSVPPQRPFERLGSLPEDVSEALEAFKVVIVRHRLSHWAEISQDEVVACLDALKKLALAPMEE